MKILCEKCPSGKANLATRVLDYHEFGIPMIKRFMCICEDCFMTKIGYFYRGLFKKLIIKAPKWCHICEEKHLTSKYICLPTMTKDWLDVLSNLK